MASRLGPLGGMGLSTGLDGWTEASEGPNMASRLGPLGGMGSALAAWLDGGSKCHKN
jgi:hypothetical protein